MVEAVSFDYKGKSRLAFPLQRDERNEELLFCFQLRPQVGPRSFFARDMIGIKFTALRVERGVIEEELRQKRF